MKAYPRWFLPLLITSVLVLSVSGLLLVPTALDMRFEQDVWWRLAFDQRLLTVSFHTSLSYLVLMLVGALSTVHMRAGLRKQANHHSGLLMLVVFLMLTMTGTALLYLGDELSLLFASACHMLLGVSIFALFVWHMRHGRKRSRQYRENPEFNQAIP